jgi:hypothetical protein
MNYKLFTIIVNSSDGFEDCWHPFFTLFKKYWPDNQSPVFLNTEFKNYVHPGLNIKSTKVHEGVTNSKLTWSECLIKALQKVETPFVLYLQEDYFIECKVNEKKINEFSELMFNNPKIKYIGLTHFGNKGPFKEWENKDLVIVSQNANYRISTQAAIWDKKTLLSYLKVDENGWMFEIFGSKRAKKNEELFLTTNRNIYNKENPIIQYEHTGIIKGKWHHKMPELFLNHLIDIDFDIRGIYKPKYWFIRKIETLKKLLNNPIRFIQGIRGK